MRVPIPQLDTHPLVRITVTTPKGPFVAECDNCYKHLDIELPEGVEERHCSVVAEFKLRSNKIDPRMKPIVIREAESDPEPKPEPEPEPEPKAESNPESKPEPEPESESEPEPEYPVRRKYPKG
jgi:hypothetical protein